MWLELLKERVEWWNKMIVDINPDIKSKNDRIKIQYTENGARIEESDTDTNVIFYDKRIDYGIRLVTETELFHTVVLSLLSTGRAVGYEQVAERVVKDCITAGFNNNINAIRHLHKTYPEQFPYGKFIGG